MDSFDDNPRSVRRGESKPNVLQRGIYSTSSNQMYMESFPGGGRRISNRSMKGLSKANFGTETTLRRSTVNGLMKDQLRLTSMLSFGNGSIKRLKGDSTRYIDNKGGSQQLPQLLCLHGWRSNSDISQFHLENLGILDKFDTVYLNGPIDSDEPADEAIGILTPGPYYSWVDQDQSVDSECRIEEIITSLKSLMLHLLLVPESKTEACYDAVFAFSQAVPLVCLLSSLPVRRRVLRDMGIKGEMQRSPWKFVIAACGANVNIILRVLDYYDLSSEAIEIPISSAHIIGIHDQFKLQSEEFMAMFPMKETLPFYLDSGHEIPALTRRLDYIPYEIIEWLVDSVRYYPALGDQENAMPWLHRDMSMVETTYVMQEFTSSRSRNELQDIGSLEMGAYRQLALNHIEVSKSNLLDMLRDADPNSPALYAPGVPALTYGSLLEFIYGKGDLRRVGANQSFIVAYLAPLGAVSAVAFLAIASQCTAAPLDPAYTVQALLLAFDQLYVNLFGSF